jgi:hypothetical protein
MNANSSLVHEKFCRMLSASGASCQQTRSRILRLHQDYRNSIFCRSPPPPMAAPWTRDFPPQKIPCG